MGGQGSSMIFKFDIFLRLFSYFRVVEI